MYILFYFFFVGSLFVYPTTMNGKFLISNPSDTALSVKLQINTDTGFDDLGGATFVIDFDTASLSFNYPPMEEHNYTFHNFSGGKYEKATVTKVLPNQLWVNIELAADNEGTLVHANDWTDVLTVYFNKKNEAENFCFEAQNNSIYWSVFDGNNKTFWNAGNFTSECVITGNEENNIIPANFELSQNYPNPFNPSTKISFKLKTGGNTKMILYDILGREVGRIIDKELAAGSYQVEISGSSLPSGIYIYTLHVEKKYSEVRKMVLLK